MSLLAAVKIGVLVFIPGDILKTAVAALVVAPLRQRLHTTDLFLPYVSCFSMIVPHFIHTFLIFEEVAH